MEGFDWNPTKNERLKKVRGFGFEEVILSRLITIRNHPSRIGQEIMCFEFQNSVWLVPFVRSGNRLFLKTLYQSRKYTRLWKRGEL